jgi:photosystem II stability/assembly factor-like uncharacterized protein
MKTRNSRLLTLLAILVSASEINCAFAEGWTQTSAPSNAWQSVATSADGVNLVAVANLGTIYISTNSGSSWDPITNSLLSHLNWRAVASSADGSKLLAGAQSSWLYSSTNSGATWIRQTNLPIVSWSTVAISGTGNKWFAFAQQMYISSDSGATWTTNNLPYQYGGGAVVSAEGNTLAFGRSGYPLIYTSTNVGATWVTNSMPFYIMGMALSADGSKLAVACLDGGILTSTNSGNTWAVTTAPNIPWRGIASSADGNVLVAAEYYGSDGSIFYSTDAGLTWVSNNLPNLQWTSLASSADGGKLFAAASGPIYSRVTAPEPRLNFEASNGNGTVSWIIPSAPFTVQESADLLNWGDSASTPVVNLDAMRDELSVPTTGEKKFFRLHLQ